MSDRNYYNNLSSSTLFTFMGKLSYLLKAIEDQELWARYHLEKLPVNGKKIGYLAPIKCFCDIPLGAAKAHMEQYGRYGLGINKSYLLDNHNLTPLVYLPNDRKHVRKLFYESNREALINNPLLPYFKKYKGKDYFKDDNGNRVERMKKFYDEREWRYVPKGASAKVILYKDQDDVEEIENKANDVKDQQHYLPFVISSIEYIILRNNDEIEDLLKIIDALKISTIERNVLITKIITSKNIYKDF